MRKRPGRIDRKTARRLALRRDAIERRQRPGCRRRCGNSRCCRGRGSRCRGTSQSGWAAISAPLFSPLNPSGKVESVCSSASVPRRGVIAERHHLRQHLAQHVGELAVGAEGQMARARTRRNRRKRRIARREAARGRVDPIREHPVQPEIRGEHEAVVGRHRHGVAVRSALPRLVHARAGVLEERRRLTQLPVLLQRKRGDAAAAVVRHEQPLAGAIDREMTRTAAA